MVQQNPLSRGIPGVVGERPPPQFGLGGFNDAAMALAYGGQTPQQAMQMFEQSQARAAAPQGRLPGSTQAPVGPAQPPVGTNPYTQYGGFDPAAYLAANPDILQYYQQNTGRARDVRYRDPMSGDRTRVRNPYDFAFYHWQGYGQNEGRPLGI